MIEQATEIRTFLIADVRGYTRFTQEYGDEAGARLASTFAVLAREGVAARGGKVIELRGDEALAVFASARQAIRAAVDLQQRFASEVAADASLPLLIGIGLDAGEAVPVEGGFRGGALNLAARLCSLAGPGEVLASEGLIHLARKVEGLEYEERGLVQLKGFADPIRVMHVTSAVAPDSPPSGVAPVLEVETTQPVQQQFPLGGYLGSLPTGMLVGRAQEIAGVLVAVEEAEQSTGRLVLLSGEPGVGKTRLAQEVSLHLRNHGFLLCAGRCYEAEQNVPFYPFLEALATLFQAAPATVRADVPRRWAEVARLLPDQVGPLRATAGSEQEEQQRLFRAVTGLVSAVSEHWPVALLLDDLQWADASSLKLLQHLTRQTHSHRVFLLGTYRDVEVSRRHPLEGAMRDLEREHLLDRVSVLPLEQEGTEELIAEMMGESEISEEFTALVFQRTEGNPFFVQQVLRVMVDRGDVYREGGRWERKDVEDIDVPDSVRSVIDQRLMRLAEDSQEVLREASVLGQTFAFDELQKLGGREEEALEHALEEAMAAGLVRESGNDSYAFDHTLTRQALYAELTARRRRRLHLAAGEVLEALPERARERRVADLARHFLEGDAADRALPYVIQAADQAAAMYAHSEAEWHYRMAGELAASVEDSKREAEALRSLGNTLRLAGRFQEAIEVLEQAAARYAACGDRAGAIKTATVVGRVYQMLGESEAGVKHLNAFLDPSDEAEDSDIPEAYLAEFYSVLAHLHWIGGKYAETVTTASRASGFAKAAGDDRILAEAEVRRGTALTNLGRSEGLDVLQAAVPLAEAAGDLETLTRAITNIALTHSESGAHGEALSFHQRALEISERLGTPAAIAFALVNLGSDYEVQGDWASARERYERAVEVSRNSEVNWIQPYMLGCLGGLNLIEGRREEGMTMLTEASALASEHNDLQALQISTVILVEDDLLRGDAARALERLTALRNRFTTEDSAFFSAIPLAHTYFDLGAIDKAEEILDGSHAQSSLFTAENRVRARIMAARGRWEEVEQVLEADFTSKHDLPYEQAQTLFVWGSLLLDHGDADRGREKLQEALSVFERLGARPWAERTRDEVQRL